MDKLRDLRVLAIRDALGEVVGANLIIETALRALLDGVDAPSLPLLAGLSRRDESDAHVLFVAVVSELDLAPQGPIDTRSARWLLVRWLCEDIVGKRVEPESAGRLIWYDGWNELGYPEFLQPLVGWVSEWEDWDPSWDVERDHFRRLIVEEATRLLGGPWPPS
jgi:hypothetical protein